MAPTREWQLQDAKNRFSELVRLAQASPQTVTVHGKPSAVIVSFEDYTALKGSKESLVDVMKTAPEGFDSLTVERDRDATMRTVSL